MYYEDGEDHGLPFDPFKAIIAPRPIGWISTVDGEGRRNLAPYSFFNAFGSRPNMIGFSSEGLKHSMANVLATGEFVFNLATRPLLSAMNQSSAAYEDGVSEFRAVGLSEGASRRVRPPRVAEAAAALECKLVHSARLDDASGRATHHHLAIGQVIATHIDKTFIKDGRFDAVAAQTIARCGYRDFTQIHEVFEVMRPDDPLTLAD